MFTDKDNRSLKRGKKSGIDEEQTISAKDDVPLLKLRSYNKKSLALTNPNLSTSTEASGLKESNLNIKSKELAKHRKNKIKLLQYPENEFELNTRNSDLENNDRETNNIETAITKQKQRKRKTISFNSADCFNSTLPSSKICKSILANDSLECYFEGLPEDRPKGMVDLREAIHYDLPVEFNSVKSESEETQSFRSGSISRFDLEIEFDTRTQTEVQLHQSLTADQGVPASIESSIMPESVLEDTANERTTNKINLVVKPALIRNVKDNTSKKMLKTGISSAPEFESSTQVETQCNKKNGNGKMELKVRKNIRKVQQPAGKIKSPNTVSNETHLNSLSRKSKKPDKKKIVRKKSRNSLCCSSSRELLGFDENFDYVGKDLLQKGVNAPPVKSQDMPLLDLYNEQTKPNSKHVRIEVVENPLVPNDFTINIANNAHNLSSINSHENVPLVSFESSCKGDIKSPVSENCKNPPSTRKDNVKLLKKSVKNIKKKHRDRNQIDLSSPNKVDKITFNMKNESKRNESGTVASKNLDNIANEPAQLINNPIMFINKLEKPHFFVAETNSEKNIGKVDKSKVANVLFNLEDLIQKLNVININGFSDGASSFISNLIDLEPNLCKPSPQNTKVTDQEIPNSSVANSQLAVNFEAQSAVNNTSYLCESDDNDDIISLYASSITSFCDGIELSQHRGQPHYKTDQKAGTSQQQHAKSSKFLTDPPQSKRIANNKITITKMDHVENKTANKDFDFVQPSTNNKKSNGNGILLGYCVNFMTSKCDNDACQSVHRDAESLCRDVNERLANAQKDYIASAYGSVRLHSALRNRLMLAFLKASAEKNLTDLFLNMTIDICLDRVLKGKVLKDCTYLLSKHKLPIWQHADLLLTQIQDCKENCLADILLETCSNCVYSEVAWLVIRLTVFLSNKSKLVKSNTVYKLLENLIKEDLPSSMYKDAFESLLMKVPDWYLESIPCETLCRYIEKLKSTGISYYTEFSERIEMLKVRPSHLAKDCDRISSDEPHCSKTLLNPTMQILPELPNGRFVNVQPEHGPSFRVNSFPRVGNNYMQRRPMVAYRQRSSFNQPVINFNRNFRQPSPAFRAVDFNGFQGHENPMSRQMNRYSKGPNNYH